MFESDQSINAKFKAAEIQFECETVVANTRTNLIRGACVGDILKYSEGNLTKMDDFTQVSCIYDNDLSMVQSTWSTDH